MALVLPSVYISLVTFGQLDTFEIDDHSPSLYIKLLDMFPLLSRYNGFTGTPMKAPLDGSITKRLTGGKTEEITAENIYRSTS
jgi:hypothetical protein